MHSFHLVEKILENAFGGKYSETDLHKKHLPFEGGIRILKTTKGQNI